MSKTGTITEQIRRAMNFVATAEFGWRDAINEAQNDTAVNPKVLCYRNKGDGQQPASFNVCVKNYMQCHIQFNTKLNAAEYNEICRWLKADRLVEELDQPFKLAEQVERKVAEPSVIQSICSKCNKPIPYGDMPEPNNVYFMCMKCAFKSPK